MWQVIKAPLAVQFSRIAFSLYIAFFTWPLWKFRHTISKEGIIVFGCFLFFSLLGIFYSFVRARHSRWIMSAIMISIPAIVLFEMYLMKIFSSPQTWWEWLLEPLPLFVWFAFPATFSYLLFKDKKAKEYFTGAVT
ncbi:MAG: hypothetical protein WDM80_02070 [Limisphaerales bacterium]